jgi:hypothetical protein
MNQGNENHILTSITGGQAATPWLAKEEQQDSTQGKTRVPDDGQSCFSFGPKASAGSHRKRDDRPTESLPSVHLRR